MEIERKFTIKTLPENLEQYPCLQLEQGYISTEPVIRIRKQNDQYILTCKGKGFLAREEFELPLSKENFLHLKSKCDGNVISKKRYLIPLTAPTFSSECMSEFIPDKLTVELDIFDAPFAPLVIAEVEFSCLEAAEAFIPPEWFGEDVTNNLEYHNSALSCKKF